VRAGADELPELRVRDRPAADEHNGTIREVQEYGKERDLGPDGARGRDAVAMFQFQLRAHGLLLLEARKPSAARARARPLGFLS
jgi:hypothetical protein